ncbi:hypothetical protein OUZ56_028352 [Daphnia magna]|uniref:Uncharacterized protein n=1 Tax=Daphnia magna TaxID=35525 RepID=A0ABR0B3L2_9CRUS|nr:hypothetical protein OUZ56_028352 [Daphnia magna]
MRVGATLGALHVNCQGGTRLCPNMGVACPVPKGCLNYEFLFAHGLTVNHSHKKGRSFSPKKKREKAIRPAPMAVFRYNNALCDGERP